jgi:serine/threonine protein phosphatase PrpC
MENGRVNSILGVSRAIGDYYLQPPITSEPEIFNPVVLQPGKDEFVIMACDGLWDVIR